MATLGYVGAEPVDTEALADAHPWGSSGDALVFVGVEPCIRANLTLIPTATPEDGPILKFVGAEPVDQNDLDTSWNDPQ